MDCWARVPGPRPSRGSVSFRTVGQPSPVLLVESGVVVAFPTLGARAFLASWLLPVLSLSPLVRMDWSIRSDPSPVTSRPGVEGFRGPTALLPWWGSLCGSLSTNHDTPFPAKHKYLLALAGVVGGGRSKERRAQDATMPAHDRRWWPWAGIGADYTRALRGGPLRVVQRLEEISKEIARSG